MADAYEKADAREREQTRKVNPYPCLMVVTARIANRWHQPDNPKFREVQKLITDAQRATAERGRTDPRFWHGTNKADTLLLRQLAEGDLGPDQQSRIASAYLEAWRRTPAPENVRWPSPSGKEWTPLSTIWTASSTAGILAGGLLVEA